EALRLHEVEAQVERHRHALPRRPDLHRVDLAGDGPVQRPPRPAEARREGARHHQHRHRVPLRHLAPVSVCLHCFYLAGEHERAADHEEQPPAVAVHGEARADDAEDVHEAENDGAHQRGIALEPDCAEQYRGEEGRDGHAGEVEEHRERDGHDQVRPVLAPQDPPERALVVPAVVLHGGEDVVELGVDVDALAAHPLERGAGEVVLPAQDQAARRVRDERRAGHHDGGRERREAERQAPSPHGDPRRAVVDQVGDEVPDADEQREAGDEPAAPPRRRHLGEVHRRGLAREPEPQAKQHPPDDEHGNVDRGGVHERADQEHAAPDQHDGLPSGPPGDAARHQRPDHAERVQRRGERRERLAVVDAVHVLARVRRPLQQAREELLQE
ncbi:Os04g0453450, partial [Oryza sativa Japonica Group]